MKDPSNLAPKEGVRGLFIVANRHRNKKKRYHSNFGEKLWDEMLDSFRLRLMTLLN